MAEHVGTVLCYGILERDADVVYNTQVLVNGQGIIGKQRKIHMPHVEYLYWRGGFEARSFDIEKARVGILICYKALFSELARTLYFSSTEILIMPFAYNTRIPRARFLEEDIACLTYRTTCYSNGCCRIMCNNAGNRTKNEWEPRGIRFPGWAEVFGADGNVLSFTRKRGNGETLVKAILDPSKISERRKNPCFVPSCLRPEVYRQIDESDQSGLRH